MASVEVIHGDMRDVLGRMVAEGKVVQAVVTDPPYHLTNNSVGNRSPNPGQYTPIGKPKQPKGGFMGKQWDGGDIAFQPGTWRLCFELLPPGGHLLAFAGTRTFHRMAVAIEEAGFEIRDTIAWLYGSGFPKSLNVSKAIDKSRAGLAFDEIRDHLRQTMTDAEISQTTIKAHLGYPSNSGVVSHWVANSQPGVPCWQDWLRLKEIMPLSDDFDDIIRTADREIIGTRLAGIANPADDERHTVGGSKSVLVDITAAETDAARQWDGWGTALKPAMELICLARKPLDGTVAGNVLAHGTGGINIDGCRIGLSEGDDPRLGGAGAWRTDKAAKNVYSGGYAGEDIPSSPLGRWPANVCHDGSDEVVRAFPETNGQGGAVTGQEPSKAFGGDVHFPGMGRDRTPFEPRLDSGSAARFFYSSKADAADRLGSKHPTVKPVDLMRWLVRLITPPGGTVLDPFAGSGTTGMACMAEGFDCILIEREAEYVADIKARIAHVHGDDMPLFADKPVVTPQQLVLL